MKLEIDVEGKLRKFGKLKPFHFDIFSIGFEPFCQHKGRQTVQKAYNSVILRQVQYVISFK